MKIKKIIPARRAHYCAIRRIHSSQLEYSYRKLELGHTPLSVGDEVNWSPWVERRLMEQGTEVRVVGKRSAPSFSNHSHFNPSHHPYHDPSPPWRRGILERTD